MYKSGRKAFQARLDENGKTRWVTLGKHVHQNWQTLKDFVFPELGDVRLDQIRQRDIVRILDPVWREKHETARRTLGRVSEIYELAKVHELVEVNPADFSLKAAFGSYRRQHKHHAALPLEQVPEFWKWLRTVRCDEMTRQITMLLVLTAKRTTEARFACWSDFDEERTIWTTSQERMKMRRGHRVPLVWQTQIILDNLDLIRAEGTNHVFGKPRSKSGVISENAALNLVKRFDPGITMHGFRSSFRSWARKEARYHYDVMEIALSHEKDDLIAAYERDDLLEERRPMMTHWADFVTGGEDPVSLRAQLAERAVR